MISSDHQYVCLSLKEEARTLIYPGMHEFCVMLRKITMKLIIPLKISVEIATKSNDLKLVSPSNQLSSVD